MPLPDRLEFRTWLDDRTATMVGRRHGDPNICTSCGNDLDHRLNSTECLAEQFGIETAERWLAEAVAGVIHAAADPPILTRMLAESVAHMRDAFERHVHPPGRGNS